ncbi:methyltransferase domain-containing protein [Dyella sp. 2HG41-7]|uniref:class I SAM-dependent methyltransferase n=1 Tax=Dyella sp. 2HG41-7 TaxID=2883239 RepID=UPI001F24149C|nr:methyltransferase domain-containing protein [Dyella sp. 2HG41-7]
MQAPDTDDMESGIVPSWLRNADAWTNTVRNGLIESRRQVTDNAILKAVLDAQPRSVLDVGCGEGWLVRALAAHGIDATGVDAVPTLVERAREAGGTFQVASYDDVVEGRLRQRINTAVCNFSLLGKTSVERFFEALPLQMNEDGRFIVQTVHPVVACGEHAYVDGWRNETWAGFGGGFSTPAPWYFRTMANWISLFSAAGWRVCEMREPLHPKTMQPASLIFIACPR